MDSPILEDKYLIKQQLDNGSTSNVFKCLNAETNELVIVKKIISKEQKNITQFKNEINILKILEGDILGIPKILGTSEHVIIFDYQESRDLFHFLQGTEIDFSTMVGYNSHINLVKPLFLQLCKIVKYSHSKGIIHRDLKIENVIVTDYKSVRLIDWGLSLDMNTPDLNLDKVPSCGTVYYVAPEALNVERIGKEKHINYCNDIWSLGVIFHIMLTKMIPFGGKNETEIINKIIKFNVGYHPAIPAGGLKLLKRIFVHRQERCSLDDIIENEWLNS